jgi:hypothetical protein
MWCAVVVILSTHFIRKKYPMEELHLLLERDRQASGTRAKVLPVFYDITPGDLKETYKEYAAAAGDDLKQQWARNLKILARITGIRPDQVRCSRQGSTGPKAGGCGACVTAST